MRYYYLLLKFEATQKILGFQIYDVAVMCLNLDWFDTYEVTDDTLYTSAETACRVIVMGNVKIRMHDGAIRTLT